MNKLMFFNDTKREIRLHPATETHGVICDMSPIQPLEQRVFTLPYRTTPIIKQWDDGSLLVSGMEE